MSRKAKAKWEGGESMKKDQLIASLLGTDQRPTQLSVTLDNWIRGAFGSPTREEKVAALNSVFSRASIEPVRDQNGTDYIINLSPENGEHSVFASELRGQPTAAESTPVLNQIYGALLKQRGAGV